MFTLLQLEVFSLPGVCPGLGGNIRVVCSQTDFILETRSLSEARKVKGYFDCALFSYEVFNVLI